MIEFKTIYFTPTDWNNSITEETIIKCLNERLSETANFKGIIIFNGINDDSFSTKTLWIIPCKYKERLKDYISYIFKSSLKNDSNTKIAHVSYWECTDDLEICKNTLMLTKLLNPVEYKERSINEKIDFLQNRDNDYDEFKFNHLDKNILIQIKNDLFGLERLSEIPDSKGIYFIYNENHELLYIGRTIHLNTRLKQHFNGTSNTWDISDNFKLFKYVTIEDESLLDDYETYLINKLKPLLNASKVYSYNSYRYDPAYNKKLKDFGCIKNLLRYDYMKKLLEEKFNLSNLLKEYEENQLIEIEKRKHFFT